MTSITVIDSNTTIGQAALWRAQLEALYDAHYENPNPCWIWNDTHDTDFDALVELSEVSRSHTHPPIDMEIVSAFRTPDWRHEALRSAFPIPPPAKQCVEIPE